MSFAKRLFIRSALPLLLLGCLLIVANIKWSGTFWKYTVMSDGKGYYAYLPATFIYHDLNFSFYADMEARYGDEHTRYDYRSGANGQVIDKYFCGVAVLQTPFFLAGHVAAQLSGSAADGYSMPYMMAMSCGAIFYLALGLYALRNYLVLCGASLAQATFLVLLIFFGTNLFHYALIEPLMSHLYSFTCVSLFLLYGKKWIDNGKNRYGAAVALLLALIIVIRPVNGLVIGWLFIEAGSIQLFFNRVLAFFRDWKLALSTVVVGVAILCIQFIIYYLQTGLFFVDAYGGEGFHFLHPEIWKFLFSYKKGMFVYVPITLLALGGFYFLFQHDRKKALRMFLFLFIVVYVLSSWWMWYYGGSFGSRVMVEYLPFFALLLLYLLNGIRQRPLKITLISVLIVFTLFCQFQTYQYRNELIHWSEMTKENYWEVFLQLKKPT